MKKIFLLLGLLSPINCFAANWVYVTSSSNESYYVDKDYYHYDAKNKTVEIWSKSVGKKSDGSGFYTSSKSLDKYYCSMKKFKSIAFVEYAQSGNVTKSRDTPSANLNLIFPETIAEGIWKVACNSNGKGFRFSKYQSETGDASSISY
ncbi:surface-adhesin E family protein [Acinetobacter sp. WA-87]|uniref:surface-adhesin E family protein n=1 Tax=Acinetobacter sp. WA-87 TaxID=3153556 RepID=UPI0032640053